MSTPAIDSLPPVSRIDVGSLSLAYRQAGSGPPLVLLHGAYEDGRYWAGQLTHLSDAFRVIALDVPGFGLSDDPPQAWGPADYAHAIAGFIETLGLGQPHVLGLSFGSVLALLLYREHPNIVGSLVLASAYAGWAGSLPPDEVQRRLEGAAQELGLEPRAVAARWLPTLLSPSASAEHVVLVESMFDDFHRGGMKTALHALGHVDLREMLGSVRVPTLLVYGADDVRSPAAVVGEDLRAKIPGSSLVVIPDAPHLVSLEQPTEFNRAVRGFLSEHAVLGEAATPSW
jgi:pimeloyl-ACP methyl ester carboxylesterase